MNSSFRLYVSSAKYEHSDYGRSKVSVIDWLQCNLYSSIRNQNRSYIDEVTPIYVKRKIISQYVSAREAVMSA